MTHNQAAWIVIELIILVCLLMLALNGNGVVIPVYG